MRYITLIKAEDLYTLKLTDSPIEELDYLREKNPWYEIDIIYSKRYDNKNQASFEYHEMIKKIGSKEFLALNKYDLDYLKTKLFQMKKD